MANLVETVRSLIAQGESSTVDFKAQAERQNHDSVCKDIAAFATSDGGDLVIGVRNGTREILGVEDPESVQDRIASWTFDYIKPSPEVRTSMVELDEKMLVHVHVLHNQERFFCINGEPYERVGATSRKVSDENRLQRLRQAAHIN